MSVVQWEAAEVLIQDVRANEGCASPRITSSVSVDRRCGICNVRVESCAGMLRQPLALDGDLLVFSLLCRHLSQCHGAVHAPQLVHKELVLSKVLVVFCSDCLVAKVGKFGCAQRLSPASILGLAIAGYAGIQGYCRSRPT